MKRVNLFLFFILIYSVGIGQLYYDSALKKYHSAEFRSAIDLFTKCIANKEKIPLAYMYRGASNAFSGDFADAFKDLNTSLKLDPANDKIYYYFGKVYLLHKDYRLAVGCFEKSIKSKSNDPERFDGLATAEMFQGNFANAVEYENYAIRLDSSQSDYFLNRGFAKLKLDLFENSIIDLTKSLSLEKSYKGYYDRGLAYSQLKMYPKAIDDYNSSLSIYPENAEALYFRGLTFKYMEMAKEACRDFKKSSDLGFAEASKMLESYCR